MHPDAKELFAIDENLRREADEMSARSGIGPILAEAGFKPVGSYVMHTMTWRDLDFERQEEPDWGKHWEVGGRLVKTGWCWRLNGVDHAREPMEPFGLYWSVRAADPIFERVELSDPAIWKFDLWTAAPEGFYQAKNLRAKWGALLTDESRAEIIAIKQVACKRPEFRKNLLSIHVYQAVLEEGVRGVEAFMEWWRGKYKQDE